MKKAYTRPVCLVVEIDQTQVICASQIEGNAGFTPGGGGSGQARAPRNRDWQDWENGN